MDQTREETKSVIKTKWQQMMDAPKGSMEYNPSQTFALQVFWVVRSPTAATQMLKNGFSMCAKATMRDTPTTLSYFFRISRDQRLATKLKEEVKTIGQHPHYKPSFKSIEMGIPQSKVEMKLKIGGIDLAPLSWGPNEPISGHEKELDFDPVVLECTEVYLDDQSFYEHGASREWMKSYPEIMMASRSLVPTTFCLGNPTERIWESTLDSMLHAIRIPTNDSDDTMKTLQPGVFVCPTVASEANQEIVNESFLYFDFDLVIRKENVSTCRDLFSLIQKEIEAPFMIVLPTNVKHDHDENNNDILEVRLMMSCPYSESTKSTNLNSLKSHCDTFEGRIIVYIRTQNSSESTNSSAAEAEQLIIERLGLKGIDHISLLNGDDAETRGIVAGYPLHPLFHRLIPNENFNYQLA